MKTIRKISKTPFVITLMVSLILFVSCEQGEIINGTTDLQNISVKAGQEITGEDLFKSILFADGPVTNQISQLNGISDQIKKFDSKDLDTYRQAQRDVIQYIQSKDASFFEQFRVDILSGRATVVSDALRSSVEKVHDYTRSELAKQNINIQEYFRAYDPDLDLSDYDDDIVNGVGIWLFVTVLVVLFIVINVNVNETVNMDVYASVRAAGVETSFEHQQLVVDIVRLGSN